MLWTKLSFVKYILLHCAISNHCLTVSGMNRIIFSCRFSRVFFTASGGCLGWGRESHFWYQIWSLTWRGWPLCWAASGQAWPCSPWGWTGRTWGAGRRPCSARRGGGLPACCGSSEQLLPARIITSTFGNKRGGKWWKYCAKGRSTTTTKVAPSSICSLDQKWQHEA